MMLPEFGSRLSELQFETNDDVLQSLLRLYTLEALRKWEGRVRWIDVEFKAGLDIVWMNIKGKVLSSNEVSSFVYPFYRKLIH
jgi:phage baseplate assembly protein W